MRRDFTLALMVSLLIHGGLAELSELFKQPAVRIVRPPEPHGPIIVMPTLDPDPPVIEEKHDTLLTAADFSPPTLSDIPQLPTHEAFTQPFEPPRPDTAPPGIVNIPPGPSGPPPGPEIFNPKTLDQQPIATFQAKPIYPFELRQTGVTGEVVVGFIVDATGAVQNACAVSSTNSAFESSAVRTVAHWKFKPGRKGGRAVNTRMQVPIIFSISDPTS